MSDRGDDAGTGPTPVVLVSGASRGVGQAVTGQLSRRGYRVLAGVRNAEDADALVRRFPRGVRPLRLDITSPEDVTEAERIVAEACGPPGLTGLVNNAGELSLGPLEHTGERELRRQLEVNAVAHLTLTRALLPHLRAGGGRIVFVGSIAGRSALPLAGAYSASKAALRALATALRVELAPAGVRVSLVEPGLISTGFGRGWLDRSDHDAGPGLDPAGIYVRWMAGVRKAAATPRGVSPERVARVVVRAVCARRPRGRYTVGLDARLRAVLEHLPTPVRDRLLSWAMERLARRAD